MKRASPRSGRDGAASSQQDVVERAEAYMRSHLDAPIPLSTLSQLVGRSERSLRDAFYGVRGVSPKQYELSGRLQAVRDALSDAWTRPSSVTGVASHYGFFELGRFAATYKQRFGENPSDTLKRTQRAAIVAERPSIPKRAGPCFHEHTKERLSNTSRTELAVIRPTIQAQTVNP
jgi:AraC-like DNA-binding protein